MGSSSPSQPDIKPGYTLFFYSGIEVAECFLPPIGYMNSASAFGPFHRRHSRRHSRRCTPLLLTGRHARRPARCRGPCSKLLEGVACSELLKHLALKRRRGRRGDSGRRQHPGVLQNGQRGEALLEASEPLRLERGVLRVRRVRRECRRRPAAVDVVLKGNEAFVLVHVPEVRLLRDDQETHAEQRRHAEGLERVVVVCAALVQVDVHGGLFPQQRAPGLVGPGVVASHDVHLRDGAVPPLELTHEEEARRARRRERRRHIEVTQIARWHVAHPLV
eukprot:scaffold37678_cov65-Phaeocystis_antarctica.AAC.1